MNSDLIRDVISRFPTDVKKLGFVGARFVNVEEDSRLRRGPLHIVISNFRGEDGTWLTQPRNVFRADFEWLPERRNFELLVAGQKLTSNREDILNKLIKWCLRQKKALDDWETSRERDPDNSIIK